ncbi:HupE/UreJ family protein [Yoonia sp. BS5-3]|uniref:HupE/UreJ family protein n=1 Tax=Yoonia phaeophyticola TaxID=3137369 RepID=A0ABZ2V080_9RHOB
MRISVSFFAELKVAVHRLLSSTILLCSVMLSGAQAHEVFPTIGDMRVVDDRVVFDISGNIESFVAGIDLAQTAHTDQAVEAPIYDQLRALEPQALEEAFTDFWPEMAAGITVVADGVPLTPILESVTVDPVGDVELVRNSVFQFSAALPEGANSVQIGWDSTFGMLVLRQQDVPTPFDGTLVGGGLSAPISLTGGGPGTGMAAFIAYITVGFDQVIPLGLEHILFVLGLFFLTTQPRALLMQIAFFGSGTAVTVVLAASGFLALSESLVEAVMTASVIIIAIQAIWGRGASALQSALVVAFGLMHGLALGADLAQIGVPDGQFIAAVIGFLLGTQIAALTILSASFLFLWLALRIHAGADVPMRGTIVYGVTLGLGLLMAVLQRSSEPTDLLVPVSFLNNGALLLALAIAFASVCSIVSIQMRNQVRAYSRFIVIPCSSLIAVTAAYWAL